MPDRLRGSVGDDARLAGVPAAGTGTQEPTPTNLTRMTADGIPCVK